VDDRSPTAVMTVARSPMITPEHREESCASCCLADGWASAQSPPPKNTSVPGSFSSTRQGFNGIQHRRPAAPGLEFPKKQAYAGRQNHRG